MYTDGQVKRYSSHFMEENGFFQEGVTQDKRPAMPLSCPLNHWSDLLNEVHYVSELPVVQEWQAVKVESTKKVRFSKENGLFFELSSLTTCHSWTIGSSDT